MTTKSLELFTLRANRRPGSFEVAFAGDNLGLKSGDTIATTQDGAPATFKLGRLTHFGNAGGGSLCNDRTESLYVFEARILNTPFYIVKTLKRGEPGYQLPGSYLTAAAAFEGVEQLLGEAARSGHPDLAFGVFEVLPGTKAWEFAQRVTAPDLSLDLKDLRLSRKVAEANAKAEENAKAVCDKIAPAAISPGSRSC